MVNGITGTYSYLLYAGNQLGISFEEKDNREHLPIPANEKDKPSSWKVRQVIRLSGFIFLFGTDHSAWDNQRIYHPLNLNFRGIVPVFLYADGKISTALFIPSIRCAVSYVPGR